MRFFRDLLGYLNFRRYVLCVDVMYVLDCIGNSEINSEENVAFRKTSDYSCFLKQVTISLEGGHWFFPNFL